MRLSFNKTGSLISKNPVSKAIKNRVINDKNYWQGRFPRLINNSWKRYVGFRFTKDACESTAGILTLKAGAVAVQPAFRSLAGPASIITGIANDLFITLRSGFTKHVAPNVQRAARGVSDSAAPIVNNIIAGDKEGLYEAGGNLLSDIGNSAGQATQATAGRIVQGSGALLRDGVRGSIIGVGKGIGKGISWSAEQVVRGALSVRLWDFF